MKKIIQIIPAENWEVVFGGTAHRDDGKSSYFAERLVCWALTEDEDGNRKVEGLFLQDTVEMAEEHLNLKGENLFVFYQHKDNELGIKGSETL